MEAGFVVFIIVATLFFLLGIVVGKVVNRSSNVEGILNVDCSDPADGPYLYLELTVPIAEIVDKKHVTFDVHIIR